MRRRLALQAAAVAGMIALSFLIPLGILVRDLAADRALTDAERDAESLARFVAVLAPSRGLDGALEALGTDRLSLSDLSIITSEGNVLGAPVPPDEDLSRAREGGAFRSRVEGGEAVYIPLVESDGSTAVIRAFVPNSDLTLGVEQSWLILGALGLVLTILAVLLFDSLGRSAVKAVADLYSTTERLGHGDIHARATPSGPVEIATVGEGLNRLAERIEGLLQEERETAANLSHRLRTPLAAARLSADAVADKSVRDQLLSDLDRLDRTVDHVISEARRPGRTESAELVDMRRLVEERVEFWRPLVEEQTRGLDLSTTKNPLVVRLPPADAAAMIDALLVNVIAHTPGGTPMRVSLLADGADGMILAVEDGGPGFPDAGVVERGRSEGRSTGLGLDIVAGTARAAGGEVKLGASRRLGGAMVVVSLPQYQFPRDRERSIRRRRLDR